MKKIVFCGGGTAGHVMPNIALIEKLKDLAEIHYIGGCGIEKKILSNYPYVSYHEISAPKLIRKFTLKNLSIPFKLLSAINKCKSLLKQINPSIIFSKGGFLSVPVVLASKNIPVLGHESDFSMGLANKIIYKKCKKMFFSFLDTAQKYKDKGVFSGTPIRQSIFNGNKNYLKENFHINNNLPNLLVVGGSTGAKAINDFISENINKLNQHYNVFHITGKGKVSNSSINNYYPIQFADNIQDFIASSKFIISRAGSNAIFEFLALKKPMILIPLPLDQSRGDQILNAQYFENKEFAEVILQQNLTYQNLTEKLEKIKQNYDHMQFNMQKFENLNAVDIISNEIKKYL